MKCYDESILQRFVDGETGALLLRRVAAHIKKCERCRSLAARLKRENDELAGILEEDVEPPDLSEPIMDKIRSTAPPARSPIKSGIRLPVRALRIAATVALVVLFLVFLLLDRGSSSFIPEKEVLIRTARVEGRAVQTHIFDSGESETKFIWLEKI
jgi:anti-sigma factor RsiW